MIDINFYRISSMQLQDPFKMIKLSVCHAVVIAISLENYEQINIINNLFNLFKAIYMELLDLIPIEKLIEIFHSIVSE